MTGTRTIDIVNQFQEVLDDDQRCFNLDTQAVLERYVTETGLNDGSGDTATFNFSEVALVVQAYAQLYSKKVDYLYEHTVTLLRGVEQVRDLSAAVPAAPATVVRRKRVSRVLVSLDFVPIDESPCSRARRPRRPLSVTARPPPLVLAPPDNRPRSLQLLSYDGESLGPLANFTVMSTWRNGMLCDELAPLDDELAPLDDELAPLDDELAPLDDELAALDDEPRPRSAAVRLSRDSRDADLDTTASDVNNTTLDTTEPDATNRDASGPDISIADVSDPDVTMFASSDPNGTRFNATSSNITNVTLEGASVLDVTPRDLSTSLPLPAPARPSRGRHSSTELPDSVDLSLTAECRRLLQRPVEYTLPRDWVCGVVADRALQLALERDRARSPHYLADARLDPAGGLRGFDADEPAPAVSPAAALSPAPSPCPASPEPDEDGPTLSWARRVVDLAERRPDPDLSLVREAFLRALPDEGACPWERVLRHDLLLQYSPSALLLAALMLANTRSVELTRMPGLDLGCAVVLRSRDPALYRGAGESDHIYFGRERGEQGERGEHAAVRVEVVEVQ